MQFFSDVIHVNRNDMSHSSPALYYLSSLAFGEVHLSMIERLNNFQLFGSKITVSLARFQTRQSYWRRVHSRSEYDMHMKGNIGNKEVKGRTRNPEADKKEKDDEKITQDKIRRFGGRSFILTIEDMDLYRMLEDLQWSYLKEIFSSIRPWSEAESKTYRETWIEITGVPLHCWNGTTFKRLAQLWGDFEAFGENPNCSIECENMKVLISTNQDQRICDVVELEVGNFVYDVRIMEVGFMDNSSKNVEIGKEITAQKEKRRSSTEESSSSESQSPVNGDSQRSRGVEVTLNAGNLGIQSNHGKEDITLEKVRLQEDRGGVGVSYETSAAVT
ncbi:hypothetical protein V6N13_083346 [Hibiscus sabdariffa]